MRTAFLMTIVLSASAAAAAQEPASSPDPLTLDRAIALALDTSDQLRAADAQARAAAATAADASARRLPRLDVEEVYTRTTNPTLAFMAKLGQERFGPADFAPDVLNTPDATPNFATRATLAQPFYAGGRINAGIAAARHAQGAAEADRERTRAVVVHQVVEAWSGAVLAAAHVQVAEEALRTADAHLKLVTDLREGGLVVESDVLQARVRRGEIEEQLVRSRAGLEIARAALNMAIGRDLDTAFALPGVLDLPERAKEPLEPLVGDALARRPDLRAMGRRVEAAGAMARAARGGFLPEIGLNAQYEQNRRTFTGDAGDNWSVFVAAKINVFEGGASRARLARAREEQAAARHQHALMTRGAELEVRRAWHELDAARQRVAIAAAAVEQARAGLAIVEDRYREGMTTLVELLGAQTALTEARTREVSARRDVMLGRATLDLATGRL